MRNFSLQKKKSFRWLHDGRSSVNSISFSPNANVFLGILVTLMSRSLYLIIFDSIFIHKVKSVYLQTDLFVGKSRFHNGSQILSSKNIWMCLFALFHCYFGSWFLHRDNRFVQIHLTFHKLISVGYEIWPFSFVRYFANQK